MSTDPSFTVCGSLFVEYRLQVPPIAVSSFQGSWHICTCRLLLLWFRAQEVQSPRLRPSLAELQVWFDLLLAAKLPIYQKEVRKSSCRVAS